MRQKYLSEMIAKKILTAAWAIKKYLHTQNGSWIV